MSHKEQLGGEKQCLAKFLYGKETREQIQGYQSDDKTCKYTKNNEGYSESSSLKCDRNLIASEEVQETITKCRKFVSTEEKRRNIPVKRNICSSLRDGLWDRVGRDAPRGRGVRQC